jgi:hypothetical protein
MMIEKTQVLPLTILFSLKVSWWVLLDSSIIIGRFDEKGDEGSLPAIPAFL